MCLQNPTRSAPFRAAVLAFFLLVLSPAFALQALPQSPNDMARFLAGLPSGPRSPLGALEQQPGWQRHAAELNAAWGEFERRIATRIQVWSHAKLPPSPPAMFYMFGGPDFPHANAFFPDASVYILSGLEPVGALPNPAVLDGRDLSDSLASLRRSLGNYLKYGYFITKEMNAQLRQGDFKGIVPLLYLFLARSEMTIRSVEYVNVAANGSLALLRDGRKARGVRIGITGRDGAPRMLYYFSTDLSNNGVAKSGFLKFCASQGAGGALLKSASYLLHTGGFSKVRQFLLQYGAVIVQDDSGIPLKYFQQGKWRLRPFGQYLPPIDVFKRHYQKDLARLFRSGNAEAVNFGIGYHWHPSRTNILVAERTGAQ